MRLVLFLVLIFCSCNNGTVHRNAPVDTVITDVSENLLFQKTKLSFPGTKFSHVELFRINDENYERYNFPAIEKEEGSVSPYTNGLTFVDSLGKPVKPYYNKYGLSQADADDLVRIFQDSLEQKATTCIPVYRDVFVFYNAKLKQVAQLQVCLSCGHLYLTNKKGSQRFQTSGRKGLEQLKKLINRVREK